MLKTFIVGNSLFAITICGLWFALGQDTSKVVIPLIFSAVTFGGGIVTGIVASQPAKQKRKKKVWPKTSRPALVTSNEFESIIE
jgi:hypothetical protein